VRGWESPWYNATVGVLEQIEKKIDLGCSIMAHLDEGKPLSEVLSRARLLFSLDEDALMVAQVDIFTHGITRVPHQGKRFTDEAYQQAAAKAMQLCGIEDVKGLTVDQTIRDWGRGGVPERNHMVSIGVREIENLDTPLDPALGDTREILDLKHQASRYYRGAQSVLSTLRSYVYDQVAAVWMEAEKEKDRIDLLGPDYRVVTESLDALASPVGEQLAAAADNLRSTNPAKWNACALLCRNVILELARTLWLVPQAIYTMVDGTEIEVSGGKEKNMLLAYTDAHARVCGAEERTLLTEAQGLVHAIYDVGSKGKRQVRRAEAQTILVNTFTFVGSLITVTELVPLETLSN